MPQLAVSLYLLLFLKDDTEVWIVWAWRDDDADNKLNLDLKHTYRRVSSRKYNLIKLAGSTASQAGSSGALVYAFLALVICALYMWQDFVLSKRVWVKKANPPVPHDNYLKSVFNFRSRAVKVILVCCLQDPRGLLQVNVTWNELPAKFKITWRHSNRPIG